MGMSEIIQKMKVFLQNEIPTEEIKMTDVKTKDDIILSFDGELIAGVEIFIVDETGKTPASDGDYILEDDQIVVVKDGKVEEIKVQEPIEAPEVPVVPEAEVAAAEDIIPAEDIKEEPAADSNIDERVKKLEDEINQLKSILAEMTTEMSKTELKNDIKEDLKLSRIKPTEKVELKNSNSNVQNILKNIYNTKK